jgi:septal ring factor EnvC (AmiA/AmiB activator)
VARDWRDDRIEELERENAALRAKVCEQQTIIEALKRTIAALEGRIRQLEAQLREIEARLAKSGSPTRLVGARRVNGVKVRRDAPAHTTPSTEGLPRVSPGLSLPPFFRWESRSGHL